MKKLTCSMLVVCLVSIMFSTMAFATNQSQTEQEILASLNQKSNNELNSLGFTPEEIDELRNIKTTIFSKISPYLEYTNVELEDLGFNPTQVKALNNIKKSLLNQSSMSSLNEDVSISISDENISRLFSSSVRLWVDVIPYNGSFKVNTGYLWDGRPIFLRTDYIAFAWDQGFRCSSTDASFEAIYSGGSFDAKDNNIDYSVYPGRGFVFKFPLAKTNGDPSRVPSFSKEGSGSMFLSNPNNAKSIHICWSYGHTTAAISPSVNITGAPSISFSTSIKEEVKGDGIFYIK